MNVSEQDSSIQVLWWSPRYIYNG